MTAARPPAVARFEPRTASQALAQRLYHRCDALFLVGCAGSGKTVTAVGLAAVDALSGSQRDRVVVVRPAVQADRDLGFLPGELGDKLRPYTQPVRQALSKVTFHFPPERLSFEPLGYARGLTWEDSVVVLDEAQNASYAQLLLVLTRLGRGSKLVVTGDPDQADVRPTSRRWPCDLEEVVDRLRPEPGVGVVEFPDGESLRHPLVSRVLRRLAPR